MITVTFDVWWVLGLLLFVAPFVYTRFRGSNGGYDVYVDVVIVLALCWGLLLGGLTTKLLSWLLAVFA
jgi:hypothetical protein